MKRPPLFCVHAVKQKASLAKSGLTSLATAAGGMYCVSMCKCVCVCACGRCVFTSVCVRARVCLCLSRWGDLIAQLSREGRPGPRVVRITPIKTHKRWTTMHPGLAAPPLLLLSLRVLCACHASLLLAMHTLLTLALPTMPKQIWRWKTIHRWLCTAVSAPSYRVVGQAKSCFKEPLSSLL